jgi:ABC-type branched-subunit amino acid transport system ATPase component
MLKVDSVTSGYVEGIDILTHVSLEIKEGIITGMIGPNGAGKSTLLKVIFAFLNPRQGKILFEGQEIQNTLPSQLKWMGMSYVPQGFSTFPQLTVEDNLLLGAWIFRRDRKLLDQRLKEVYEFFPLLRERRKEKATYLSGGILRMLCIGKEIITKPKLLLIDEPSEGLAPKIVKEIYSFLLKIRDQGTTIFLVDQNILKALEVSDYMYLLEMGRIKQKGPKQEFEENIREIIRDSLISR